MSWVSDLKDCETVDEIKELIEQAALSVRRKRNGAEGNYEATLYAPGEYDGDAHLPPEAEYQWIIEARGSTDDPGDSDGTANFEEEGEPDGIFVGKTAPDAARAYLKELDVVESGALDDDDDGFGEEEVPDDPNDP